MMIDYDDDCYDFLGIVGYNIWSEVAQGKGYEDYPSSIRCPALIHCPLQDFECLSQADYPLHMHPLGCDSTIFYDNLCWKLGEALHCSWSIYRDILAGKEILDHYPTIGHDAITSIKCSILE